MHRFAAPALVLGLALGGPASGEGFSLQVSGEHQFLAPVPVGTDSWETGYSGTMKSPGFRHIAGVEVKEGQVAAVSRWRVDQTLAGTQLRPLETFVTWNPEAFRLAFGYQVFSWGAADGRNPTDNLNPRDYTTLDGDKLPVLAASVTWYPAEGLSAEGVFVPQGADSLQPVDVRAALVAQGFPSVTYAPRDQGPGDFVAGGRLNLRSDLVDASVSYLYDLDPMVTPVIGNASWVTVGGVPVGATGTISLEHKRLQRFGADVKTAIDRFGFWAEGAYTRTGNPDTTSYAERLSRWDYTLGTDFSFGPQDGIYLNLQYTGTWIPGFDATKNTEVVPQRVLEKALVAALGGEREGLVQGITWNTHTSLADGAVVPTLSGAWSQPFFYDDSAATRFGNLVLKPEVDIMPVDSFHLTFGATLAWAWVKKAGSSDLTLDTTQDGVGTYTPSNHLSLRVSYKWTNDLANAPQ